MCFFYWKISSIILKWNDVWCTQHESISLIANGNPTKICCALLPPCWWLGTFNTLRPRQHGRHFADDTFKRIFLNENLWISIKISLKFVPKSPIDNIPALFQIMALRRPGDKPLSEAMMVSLLTHICVARPQWVKCYDICMHIDNLAHIPSIY